MRVFLTVIVVAGLGVGGFFLWSQWQRRQAESPDAKAVSTANVETRDISFAINAAGEIGPAEQVSVRPEINGKIAELPVDIGDQVKKGQLLCRLDDTDLQTEKESQLSQIAGARLQIEASALNVEKTEREYKRNEQLFESKLVAQDIFDNTRTDYQIAKNSLALSKNALERAEKALKQVDDKLAKTRIEAPFDCTVLTRPVSLGQTVSGSAGFNSGTEILTVANLNDMIITAHINQADVTRMKNGQPVEVQVESVPGLRLKGEVERIAPQAIIKNGIKGFSARIAIQNIDPRIRPGMTSILTVPVSTVENALSVPLSAVFTEKGERFVYVKDGSEFERRTVQIGISDYSFAEVHRGLQEGDVVALELPSDVKSDPISKPPKDSKPASTNGVAGAERPTTSVQPIPKKAVL
ncbi:MAG TPA: efflux RND transporter periplasmic adaptor subunit [Methylomirabilota bacterium]|nr:efflux RND transporter periplasmic adaptor subunit [Methylomirabilota bacterium]